MSFRTIVASMIAVCIGLTSMAVHSANYVRLMHASQCYELIGGDLEHGVTWPNNQNAEYNEEGRDALLVCPVIDDATAPKTSITAYGIDMYVQSPANTFMQPCVKYYGSTGGACGTKTYASGQGIQHLSTTANLAPWSTDLPDFGYILVGIGDVNSGVSKFFGWWVSIPTVP